MEDKNWKSASIKMYKGSSNYGVIKTGSNYYMVDFYSPWYGFLDILPFVYIAKKSKKITEEEYYNNLSDYKSYNLPIGMANIIYLNIIKKVAEYFTIYFTPVFSSFLIITMFAFTCLIIRIKNKKIHFNSDVKIKIKRLEFKDIANNILFYVALLVCLFGSSWGLPSILVFLGILVIGFSPTQLYNARPTEDKEDDNTTTIQVESI